MLRLYVPTAQKRVYPPGIKQGSLMPRITITPLTPTEKRVGLGEGFGTNKGLWLQYTFRVDIWDSDPTRIETVASEVQYAVWKHREYVPATAADAAKGQFVLLEIRGGGSVALNEGVGVYQRTMNVAGIWLAKSSETW